MDNFIQRILASLIYVIIILFLTGVAVYMLTGIIRMIRG